LGALEAYPTLLGVSADAGYRKTFEEALAKIEKTVDISIKSDKWSVLPKRWIVERSFAWLNGFRRLAKDFEKRTCAAETMVVITNIAILINRL
jgi:putative transposase